MTTLLLRTSGMLAAAAAHAVARSKKAVLVSRHTNQFSLSNDALLKNQDQKYRMSRKVLSGIEATPKFLREVK
tara:strand:- start:1485 stop:1703 length:219 start_codon:yes stop_codon:yes gene_type:complete